MSEEAVMLQISLTPGKRNSLSKQQPCREGLFFFPETGRFSKKNREAIVHERAITERD
jgi:hypothetical protein